MIVQETRIRMQEAIGDEAEAAEFARDRWNAWPVSWSAVWVGALASVAAVIVLGLVGTSLGTYLVGPEHRVVDLHKIGLGTLAFSVFSAFFACVIGGWIAGKISGFRRSEPAMLHGAISWLIAVPIVVALAGVGAGSYLGGWYGGLAGRPAWAAPAAAPFERPEPIAADASDVEVRAYQNALTTYRQDLRTWKEETPRATRYSALGGVTALLIGLMGSVIGGWMACGEPMSLTHYRTRDRLSGAAK